MNGLKESPFANSALFVNVHILCQPSHLDWAPGGLRLGPDEGVHGAVPRDVAAQIIRTHKLGAVHAVT